ncbi:translocase [Nocardioides sp. Root1257]|uniref:sec-independent translocase n=1 Tax=unclassified Nocardioides TaxID=2615069 RepID=UPI0006F32BDE|nr:MULTISPECIES: sec-independent translocase [unclassified Nocardioides]KQW47654.1 translocase [Nocardioides sp. Root1257]KRC45809.1 translocase [Nocardioides sp. Root224]
MFGIGLPELAVLAFVGVLFFGPDKLPDLARQSAGLLRRVKDLADGARDELRTQLGPDYSDLELRDLDPRSIVRKHVTAAFEDDHDDVRDVKESWADDDSDDSDGSAASATHPTYDEAT